MDLFKYIDLFKFNLIQHHFFQNEVFCLKQTLRKDKKAEQRRVQYMQYVNILRHRM